VSQDNLNAAPEETHSPKIDKVSRGSRLSRGSHTTAMSSHMSRLPTVQHSTLMQYAQDIFNARRAVIDHVS